MLLLFKQMLAEKFNDLLSVVLFANIKGISSPKNNQIWQLVPINYPAFPKYIDK